MTKYTIKNLDKQSLKVRKMFSRISKRYDLLNRLISFGLDRSWRRFLIRMAEIPLTGRVLDAGAGTGDIAIEIKNLNRAINITAMDISYEMISIGRTKEGGKEIAWCQADAGSLPFPDSVFDAVTSGFLARNVHDIDKMFKEQVRVLKPGGRLVCLDTSPIPNNMLRPLVLIYYKFIIPFLGHVIAGERDAYKYLPETTMQFLKPDILETKLMDAGLMDVKYRSFMLGNIAIHWGTKPGTGHH